MLNLLHRHDPQPEVFAAYAETVARLVATPEPAPVLRVFEIELLKLLGYAVNLDHEAGTDAELAPGQYYEFRPEQGPVPVQRDSGEFVFSGAELIAIGELEFADAAVLGNANRLLRHVVRYHLGGKELKSRKVLVDLHRGRAKIAGRS